MSEIPLQGSPRATWGGRSSTVLMSEVPMYRGAFALHVLAAPNAEAHADRVVLHTGPRGAGVFL